MNAPGKPLYTQDILSLAVSLIDWPMTSDMPHQAELRSQSCGSVVRVGLDLTGEGHVARFGVDARACALGQASAAVLAAHVAGQDQPALVAARDALMAFFSGTRADPGDWPGVEHLASALPYPARHGSILLPWRAAAVALEPLSATD
ncbi:iron-sulfur cluster assembly scaffold protein [Blastomonas sp.]|uniref:iron-sulfur cluster assembly scaffold protein n=1 Tax=Blastomonas sp. TaxID=1909299 RepID=UPI002611EC80|nr:iron-sulfur cluster assembly scaffold protein [Blastomonas sp.]MDM7956690.1 iron-sulfur cluster assembly scaffold protein [Blastomonas sp.]